MLWGWGFEDGVPDHGQEEGTVEVHVQGGFPDLIPIESRVCVRACVRARMHVCMCTHLWIVNLYDLVRSSGSLVSVSMCILMCC